MERGGEEKRRRRGRGNSVEGEKAGFRGEV